ncbi:MAG: 50S ribosomal protein L11 methyltransferase [Actinomycetota bacterium]
MSVRVVSSATMNRWRRLGASLDAPPGVHRPSIFSAFIAAAIAGDHDDRGSSELEGRVVIDAGCGAGLVTIAALRGGASHVIAQDRDPAALRATATNVHAVGGGRFGDRVEFAESDWTELGELAGDLVVVNPPQRPSRLIAATPTRERHLHDTAGEDGADALRVVLGHADSDGVLSTMSSLLDLDPSSIGGSRYASDGAVARAQLEHSEAWSALDVARVARVDAQRWSRRRPEATR